MQRAWPLVIVATLATTARADEPTTAADVAGDPLPGQESGRVDPVDDGDSTPRVIARAALFVPKVLVDVALTPVRATVYALERYKIDEWYDKAFFNHDQTIGLYPTVAFESGFGVSGIVGGLGFVDRNLFGERESITLQAAAGTAFQARQLYQVSLRSGNRLGHRFQLGLDGGYEIRPRDTFYGIGNGDLVDAPATPIDPRMDPTAVETFYSQTRARLALTADARVWDRLHVRGAGELSDRKFGAPDTGLAADMVYAPSGLVGWGGVRDAYGELELLWDSREAASTFEPTGMYAQGTLADGFAGRVHRLDGGVDYWRYGVDLQQFIRLAKGPRVLALRFHGEAVSGSADDVPFVELPMLGGGSWLRGYAPGRFRDRVAAFGTVAYQWDLSAGFAANVFTDVGRVFPALDEMSVHDLHAGYGISLDYHGGGALVMETAVGASLEGELFFSIAFNPVYNLDNRVTRR